jgi:hypothetical protein
MIMDRDGKYMQVGIGSFVAPITCTGYPAGHTRVTSFLGWISKKTGVQIRK